MSTTRTALIAVAASVASSLLVAGGVAVATHQFSDVRNSNIFHGAVSAFADAGCATGFNDGTYRPGRPVTRGQVARMFQSCGGRIGQAQDGNASVTTAEVDYVPFTVRAGAQPGGSGFYLVLGEVEAKGSGTLPCEVSVYLEADGIRVNRTNMSLVNAGDSTDEESATLTELVPVTAGQVLALNLNAEVDGTPVCAGTITADFSLTALYVPFAGDGSGGST